MVPCEAGCDGPIWSSMISSVGSEASSFCDQRAGNDMRILLLGGPQRLGDRIDLGNDRLPLLEWIILAQRMADETVIHQDAPQVRVAAKLDAEHVEAFALQPVRRLPDRIRARHPGVIGLEMDFHAQALIFADGFELIDDLE